MIRSFRHKGLKTFFESGHLSGIRPDHKKRLRLLLAKLNTANEIGDMGFPGARLHPLKGEWKGYWSVCVSGSWRLMVRFIEGEAFDVDYLNYH